MNKKWYIGLLMMAVVVIGCKKMTNNKLTGRWHYYYLSINDTGKTQYWTFNDPDQLIRIISRYDTVMCDTGTWKIEKDFMSPTFIVVDGLDNNTNGTYQLLKLNKKFLTIQRTKSNAGATDGAFCLMEFKKE